MRRSGVWLDVLWLSAGSGTMRIGGIVIKFDSRGVSKKNHRFWGRAVDTHSTARSELFRGPELFEPATNLVLLVVALVRIDVALVLFRSRREAVCSMCGRRRNRGA